MNGAVGEREGTKSMKVVVLRSPKALRGLLRILFKIKKDEDA